MAERRLTAIGYLRVSTLEQVSGFGLDVQENGIRAYCRANNLRLLRVVADEGRSGRADLEIRIGLASVIAQLEDGAVDGLVIFALDRLARDLILQETLVERLRSAGRFVRSVTEADIDSDDPTRILIRRILGAFADYDRARLVGRMAAGRATKAARGGYAGGKPAYGKTVRDKELVTHRAEAKMVAFIIDARGRGLSLRQIAAELDAAGYKPRRAARWHPTVINQIVSRGRA